MNVATAQPLSNNPRLTKAEQARRNGQKSLGPTSPGGKRNSSRNSLKHGLTAKDVIPSNQNPAAYRNILQNLRADFNPITLAEVQCIDRMAHSISVRNSAAVEITSLVNHTRDLMTSAARTEPGTSEHLRNALAVDELTRQGRTYDNYHRYQCTADREYSRALHDLLKIRKSMSLFATDPFANSIRASVLEAVAQTARPTAEHLTGRNEPTQVPQNTASRLPAEPTNIAQPATKTAPIATEFAGTATATTPPTQLSPRKNEPTEVPQNTESRLPAEPTNIAQPATKTAPITAAFAATATAPAPPSQLSPRKNEPTEAPQNTEARLSAEPTNLAQPATKTAPIPTAIAATAAATAPPSQLSPRKNEPTQVPQNTEPRLPAEPTNLAQPASKTAPIPTVLAATATAPASPTQLSPRKNEPTEVPQNTEPRLPTEPANIAQPATKTAPIPTAFTATATATTPPSQLSPRKNEPTQVPQNTATPLAPQPVSHPAATPISSTPNPRPQSGALTLPNATDSDASSQAVDWFGFELIREALKNFPEAYAAARESLENCPTGVIHFLPELTKVA